MRTAFNAFVKNLMGNPHVAKFIIRHGVGPANDTVLTSELLSAIANHKTSRKRTRPAPIPKQRKGILAQARRALSSAGDVGSI